MKIFLLTIMTILSFHLNGQNLSDHLQSYIADLANDETLEMQYAKTGCWGSYEGGKLLFMLSGDSIKVVLSNKQNYLGAKTTTTSSFYQKKELLSTLEENKKSSVNNLDNLVLANSFEYRLYKDGKQIASGTSALEPADVVNKVTLSNSLKDSFLKNQKGLLKNSGVILPTGINN